MEKNSSFIFLTLADAYGKNECAVCAVGFSARGSMVARFFLALQATGYSDAEGLDVLNHEKVQLYLESVIMEPSYKVGMFFDKEWWRETPAGSPKFPAKLTSYFLTLEGVEQLKKDSFPEAYIIEILKGDTTKMINQSFASKALFLEAIESNIEARLTIKEQNCILNVAELDTIGPSITDMPIRQVVYFGDNARKETVEKGKDKKDKDKVKEKKKVYGILASYDDIQYSTFWKPLELGPKAELKLPESRDTQPLEGPRKATKVMEKMLLNQLASLHFGPQANYTAIPKPLETRYMDWSLPPFNAGYHAYKPHYSQQDVQRMIRKPSQLTKGKDANIFIVGETYSNDLAWVEGAFCTAESVLNDFFDLKPIIDEKYYPFICLKE